MKKKIAILGAVTSLTCQATSIIRKAEDIAKEEVIKKQKFEESIRSSSLDDSKCKKGHSYAKEEYRSGNFISSKWICKNCGREL